MCVLRKIFGVDVAVSRVDRVRVYFEPDRPLARLLNWNNSANTDTLRALIFIIRRAATST